MDTATTELELNKLSIDATSGNARTGRFQTAHGAIETPVFMPVGTQASVKAIEPGAVAKTGARMLIANTYHLWLRPGAELVAQMGAARVHVLATCDCDRQRWVSSVFTG